MTVYIDAPTLKRWLSEPDEIALLDVREPGQFGERHLFFAVPLAYSRFEIGLPGLVPNKNATIVLCDDGDGVAERAAERAESIGYENVNVLEGGVGAWEAEGFTLFEGVNVPSKTFGELVEHEFDTPRISATDLQAMIDGNENFVIVDGRPFSEYRRMNIPGGICCPNGELALRIADIAPDPATQIVVNCAGRTRSIIGAQTLIDMGIPNKVVALENGTQGWFLAGLELENDAARRHSANVEKADMDGLRERADALAATRGAPTISRDQLSDWSRDDERTTYVFDVRTVEEFSDNGIAGSIHAPGGQLVQATDQWVGVRGARIILLDDEGIRAKVVASWLRQLGHEAFLLEGGLASLNDTDLPPLLQPRIAPSLNAIAPEALANALEREATQIVDIRSSMDYRAGHVDGAIWSARPKLPLAGTEPSKTVTLVADDLLVAELAAAEITSGGAAVAGLLKGSSDDWRAAGLNVVETPNDPADEDCIDYLFFTAGRHKGDAEEARKYLAWETALVGRLDEQERGVFRITSAP
ncbi:MAG: sulfurtransferase [Hyphomicrobiaceae bacterium]|nr:sulfurtransferase [Hyphomicrobiaceae bacterium]